MVIEETFRNIQIGVARASARNLAIRLLSSKERLS